VKKALMMQFSRK